ncbi:MAG: cytochrome c [Candidatus Tectomicrobia bacterium]|nr:cytochrome c [Candidatus Tectomicrobia bacterium]
MRRLLGLSLLAVSTLMAIPGRTPGQSAFRAPAVLMITFLNRTQQIAYAVGMSDWKKLKTEAEGLAGAAAAYAQIVPPGIPMGKMLKAFREDVDGLIRAAESRDLEAIGRSFGRIEAGCLDCHKRYRDL